MDGNRGLYAWHRDMRDARRNGFFRGVVFAVAVSVPLWLGIYWGVKHLWH